VVSTPQRYRGERIGLPETGVGSLAPMSKRVWALLIDMVFSILVAGLFTQAIHRGEDAASRLPGMWTLVPLALDYILGMLFLGRTLGMNLVGVRIIRVSRNEAVGPYRAFERTLLLFLLIPALVYDHDGRGLHDRLTDTAVVLG